MSFAGDTDRFLHQENAKYVLLIHGMKWPALATQHTDSSSHHSPLQLRHSPPLLCLPLSFYKMPTIAANSFLVPSSEKRTALVLFSLERPSLISTK